MTADAVGNKLRAMFIIYIAFLMATFMYVALIVSGVMAPAEQRIAEVADEAVAIGEARADAVPVAVVALMAAAGGSIFAGILVGLFYRPGNAGSPDQYLQRVQTKMILQAALYESIGIIALVGQPLGMSKGLSVGLCIVAFVLLLTVYPGLLESAQVYRRAVEQSTAEPQTGRI